MGPAKKTDSTQKFYGVLAEFSSPGALLKAAELVYKKGYRKMDAYSPFPIHGLAEVIGMKSTRLPLVVLIGGILGCLGGFFMQYYASVISYPYNVGGRPLNSWPSFIPVTFETTILVAALAAVLGMLALNGLPMPYHPLFHSDRFALATRDRFFLCIEAKDAKFDLEETKNFLIALGADDVSEVQP